MVHGGSVINSNRALWSCSGSEPITLKSHWQGYSIWILPMSFCNSRSFTFKAEGVDQVLDGFYFLAPYIFKAATR